MGDAGERALRRLSGREARRASWVNHRIALSLLEDAHCSGCAVIALADVSGMRERLRVRNPHRNRMVSLWSYGRLKSFVQYEAGFRGIAMVEVAPFY